MNEQNDLITAYLDGTLPPEARAEFERLLRSDSGLRGSLEAERLIRDTMHKELAAFPSVSGSPSAALLARLEATGTTAVAGAGATGVLGTIFGTSLGLTIVTAVGAAGLLLGLLLAPSLFDDRLLPVVVTDRKAAVQRESAGQEDQGRSMEDSAAIIRSFVPSAISEGSSRMNEERSPSTTSQPLTSSHSTRDIRNIPTDRPDSSGLSAKESGVEKRNAMMDYLRRGGEREELPVVRSDSIRLNLKLDPDR